MRKILLKTLDKNQTVIKKGKYKLDPTGSEIIITPGSKGRGHIAETVSFEHVHIIKEPGLLRMKQYGFLQNGQLYNFSTGKGPELSQTAIFEASEKKILSRLGETPKQDNLTLIIVLLQIVSIFIMMFVA